MQRMPSVTEKSPAPDPVLYIIVCGSPAATGVYDFVDNVRSRGWQTCVIPTPMGARFLDTSRLES
jgi:hypothetical protein